MLRAKRQAVRMAVFSSALVLGGLSAPETASAHKLKVFASAVGDRIQGSAYFAGGAKASGATILIQDIAGQTLATLLPDENGSFNYVAREPGDYVVVAKSADGHQAEWRISAAELAPAFPQGSATGADQEIDRAGPAGEQSQIPSPPDTKEAAADKAASTSSGTDQPGSAPLDPRLVSAIELAVARQIRPLREQLAASADSARLTDVLGGIGYILGITGLALWWRSRQEGQRKP
ncbi:carboxypeptidase regulatory-like domain-containing protein [Thiorhodococcus mannitoliphagus]|uniref:Carboxypeptidase regulatory-like domain-containing protein n=1 Tax=Thiorhodococcus mannitoliphagus TaxID=329406 RepID=A0A6P1DQF2_9GAMM|nr:carboxypeptidase-like regulatory domain-containing protein [Thiorhodococcus mannitoliphagus]NEX20507.1 carboxypeptidase regulatory-like domain-containing protein [Thiorhodococcus mannitoliphagus]